MYHLTIALSQFLKCYPQNLEKIRSLIDHWRDTYTDIRTSHNVESCVFKFMEMVDKEVKDHLKLKRKDIKMHGGIKCEKRCYYCCEQVVYVSLDEAKMINSVSKHYNEQLDWNMIERQSRIPEGDWNNQQRSDWPCVLLAKDKTCKLYKYRPLICRTHMSVLHPSKCNIETGKNKLQIIALPTTEAITSGLWNAVNDVASLPKQLMKIKEVECNERL